MKPQTKTPARANNVAGENDWNASQETLYLLSIPGMGESIVNGMKIPIDACSDQLFDEEEAQKIRPKHP